MIDDAELELEKHDLDADREYLLGCLHDAEDMSLFVQEVNAILDRYRDLETRMQEAHYAKLLKNIASTLLNLRRKVYRGKKLPFRRILMRRVAKEARILGRMRRGVTERKSERKKISSRLNGNCPPRPGKRPRGRPRKATA